MHLKLKHFAIIQLLLIISLSSCTDQNEPETYRAGYTIQNNSSHNLFLKWRSQKGARNPSVYDSYDSLSLAINDSYNWISSDQGCLPRPFQQTDSLIIFINDSVYKQYTIYTNSKGNILFNDSYQETKQNEFSRLYKYTFTDEDFNNAQ